MVAAVARLRPFSLVRKRKKEVSRRETKKKELGGQTPSDKIRPLSREREREISQFFESRRLRSIKSRRTGRRCERPQPKGRRIGVVFYSYRFGSISLDCPLRRDTDWRRAQILLFV